MQEEVKEIVAITEKECVFCELRDKNEDSSDRAYHSRTAPLLQMMGARENIMGARHVTSWTV